MKLGATFFLIKSTIYLPGKLHQFRFATVDSLLEHLNVPFAGIGCDVTEEDLSNDFCLCIGDLRSRLRGKCTRKEDEIYK